ncbi:hypothetical protein SDC9_88853 [bioreactor metagenome]|uniref:Uncharacterized protein n=1 Tax=bioreactor metagenome TaxID=1076179 RepID=A0A644ZMN3_9ZZZZ
MVNRVAHKVHQGIRNVVDDVFVDLGLLTHNFQLDLFAKLSVHVPHNAVHALEGGGEGNHAHRHDEVLHLPCDFPKLPRGFLKAFELELLQFRVMNDHRLGDDKLSQKVHQPIELCDADTDDGACHGCGRIPLCRALFSRGRCARSALLILDCRLVRRRIFRKSEVFQKNLLHEKPCHFVIVEVCPELHGKAAFSNDIDTGVVIDDIFWKMGDLTGKLLQLVDDVKCPDILHHAALFKESRRLITVFTLRFRPFLQTVPRGLRCRTFFCRLDFVALKPFCKLGDAVFKAFSVPVGSVTCRQFRKLGFVEVNAGEHQIGQGFNVIRKPLILPQNGEQVLHLMGEAGDAVVLHHGR